MQRYHGAKTRGIKTVPQGPFYEGRFGRMFGKLPTFQQDEGELRALGAAMIEGGEEDSDNPDIPAGYTYIGQFIDHDITFDPSSSLQRMNDPEGLVNFRTPRFDLDSLYGSGPSEDPFMYDETSGGVKLLVGKVRVDGRDTDEDDLPRNSQGRALTGDPRNDENTMVSQLQLAFIKFHNKVVDLVQADQGFSGDELFKEAQRIVRWHYQWAVVNDFLKRIVGEDMLEQVWKVGTGVDPHEIKLRFYRWKVRPFMPVEFSVAAYRFGHSQVRPSYRINSVVPELPIFSPEGDTNPLADFRGFRSLPQQWTIEWNRFFEIDGSTPQHSRKIDTKLAPPLTNLPGMTAGFEALAVLNLLRGRSMSLPSGHRVATAVGETPLTSEELGFEQTGYRGPAPLWYYVLKEAELKEDGRHLGPVGGRIVAEVLLGLLKGDPLSFVNVEPGSGWMPHLPSAEERQFTMADLVKFATS